MISSRFSPYPGMTAWGEGDDVSQHGEGSRPRDPLSAKPSTNPIKRSIRPTMQTGSRRAGTRALPAREPLMAVRERKPPTVNRKP